jgi:hypothetical protein
MEAMDLSPASTGRMGIALVVIAALALSVHWTMEPGKYQQLVWVVLGFFAVRILLGRMRSR